MLYCDCQKFDLTCGFFYFSVHGDQKNNNIYLQSVLHMSIINQNMMYDSSDMEQRDIFSHFGPFFIILPLPRPPSPLNNPINQNFKKKKKEKTPGDIVILHKCTKNNDYMVYCS